MSKSALTIQESFCHPRDGPKRILLDNRQAKYAGRFRRMLVKRFAQIIGVVLILVGLVGLVLGDKLWLASSTST